MKEVSKMKSFTDSIFRRFRFVPVVSKSAVAAALIAAGLSYASVVEAYSSPEVQMYAREAATEGIVLLRNNDNVLPFRKGTKVALFGCAQHQTFMNGYGSGGYVNPPYRISIADGMLMHSPEAISLDMQLLDVYGKWCKAHPIVDRGWGSWPYNVEEMKLDPEMVTAAGARNDVALVVIGRAAGEDRECRLAPGSYYLTDAEKDMLKQVTGAFKKTVVLMNVGNVTDMSWLNDYKIDGLLYGWHGGMETGIGVANVLCGVVSPSGKLGETIAQKYEDYPSAANFGGRNFNNYAEDIYVGYRYFETFAKDKVMFPFGFGMSYSKFDIKTDPIKVANDKIVVKSTVTNLGGASCLGKEVVQVYCSAPQGKLGKPSRVLVGFAKTPYLAGSPEGFRAQLPSGQTSCTVEINIPMKNLASYDDSGKTGKPFAWVLEPGDYDIYVGSSIRDCVKAGTINVPELRVVEQVESAAAIASEETAFQRMLPVVGANGEITLGSEKTPVTTVNISERIRKNLPAAVPMTGDKGIKLLDVALGKNTMKEFIAQLTPEELATLLRGDGNKDSALGIKGNASVYGGILPSLRDKGILPLSSADGPSGLWIPQNGSLMPNGTMLACTWNTDLIEKLGAAYGKEIDANGVDAVLGPGMNIHRSVLCGRNFEYFSEDPLLAGMIGGYTVRGIEESGTSAVPKHFALNNQETNRNRNDSRCSERAIREIYLRAFEIMIKVGKPDNIMGSYNLINGDWASYNYDICTTILRKEWGYTGCVMTDWWQQSTNNPRYFAADNALRVRAQTDVLMPGSGPGRGQGGQDRSILNSYENWVKAGSPADSIEAGLTLGEMQRGAENVLNFVIRSRYFRKLHNLPNTYKADNNWFDTEVK